MNWKMFVVNHPAGEFLAVVPEEGAYTTLRENVGTRAAVTEVTDPKVIIEWRASAKPERVIVCI